MNLCRVVNFLILIIVILCTIFFYLSKLYPDNKIFFVLKYTFEASLIGAIADTYAIFGLFYRIGPHTDILRKKKKDLIEKIKIFVGEFLFNSEFLDKELDKVSIEIGEYLDNEDLKEQLIKILSSNLRKILEKYKYLKFLNIIISEISYKIADILIKKLKKSEKINTIGKDLIKSVIIDNHNLIIELIEKRLNSISNDEFIETIKNSSWYELQWIRINGTILGSLIGLFFGFINLYF